LKPHPIGDLGEINSVIDLRGFVPMSLPHYEPPLKTGLIFVKVPTRKALLMLYFGDLDVTNVAKDASKLDAKDLSNISFQLEDQAVPGPLASWVRLSYGLTKNTAPELYNKLVGGNFDSVEPTTVFFTSHSSFIIISFHYSSFFQPNGQVILILEFAKKTAQYKAAYVVYSTTLLEKQTKAFLESTSSIVMREVIKAGVQASIAP
jgi:hypothetical protein